MLFRENRLYLKDYRLSDVLALIQVLSLDELAHRDEASLVDEMQGQPKSASTWKELASEHPEFFRVKRGAFNAVALVARHVKPVDPVTSKRDKLSEDMTRHLMGSAIELHDRQMRREDRFWSLTVPIWAAVAAGSIAVLLKFGDFVIDLCRASH